MGKVSVQVQQDVPASASREVFQGLFKDLGKQAMALEAILRVVCGRVDKMENWLTEVSFGMTELDLKLRNIAHNIDGTSAVDDEQGLPKRWAEPTGNEVKPVPPTVSKKLGNEKKAVRVTGMAAAILDRLASTATTPATPAVEPEKPDKPSTKKKTKDKKSNAKKTKTAEPTVVPNIPMSSVVESDPPANIQPPQPVVPVQQIPVEIPIAETPAPAKIDDPSTAFEKEATPRDEPTLIKSVTPDIYTSAEVNEVEVPSKPIETSSSPTSELPKSDGIEAKAAESPVIVLPKEKPAVEPQQVTAQENELEEVMEMDQTEMPPTQQERARVQPTTIDDKVPALAESVDKKADPDPPRVLKPKEVARMPVPSVSSILPLVEVERAPEPFVLHVPIRPAADPPHESQVLKTSAPEIEAAPVPIETTVAASTSSNQNFEKSQSISTPSIVASPQPPPQLHTEPKPTAVVNLQQPTSLPAAVKAPEVPVKSPPDSNKQPDVQAATVLREKLLGNEVPALASDPLITRSHRRASKVGSRPSSGRKHEGGDSSRRSSINKHGSRRSIQIPIPEAEPPGLPSQPVQQEPPTVLQPVAQIVEQNGAAGASPSTNTTDHNDEAEESDGSGSDGSSSSSSSSSGQEEEDAETGAAVEEINKTMTALKKLKRAQMLSPEEETELKERAHKKWFQLKGHIKEKQKKDVTNILLKRKKNVFTVSSRIELLEEKSREIFAALKQMTHDLHDKTDRSTHETLRRRLGDIEHSLQSVDSKIASISSPTMEMVGDIREEVDELRNLLQNQLTSAQSEATARHSLVEEALASQRALVESLTLDFPAQLNAQAELFNEKLKQIPDYSAAIENLKKNLRRKADLKLLKELEARLLGLDAENEDCLVRCLSCRKEVFNPYGEVDASSDEPDPSNGGQLRKVNPGPSSARIYRSNVPFNAQATVAEPIIEEAADDPQQQSAGDSYASEKSTIVQIPSARWSTPTAETPIKREAKAPQPSPLSLMNITATRAILSPDRPISAPVVPLKKKPNAAAKSKSVLKSLTLQPQ